MHMGVIFIVFHQVSFQELFSCKHLFTTITFLTVLNLVPLHLVCFSE